MIKHFKVWPLGVNKEDFFEEQKIFLIYLMGFIPSLEEWNLQMDYKKRLQEIKSLTLKDIVLEKTDIDLAKMHGKDLDKLRKERLKEEKNKKEKELNEKFGIEKEKDEEPKIAFPEEKAPNEQKKHLWDLLNGRGLIKNKEADKT